MQQSKASEVLRSFLTSQNPLRPAGEGAGRILRVSRDMPELMQPSSYATAVYRDSGLLLELYREGVGVYAFYSRPVLWKEVRL